MMEGDYSEELLKEEGKRSNKANEQIVAVNSCTCALG